MALRNIVHIDRDKCDGCGQCVTACAEGAIAIVDGKATLVSDVYCDGLGACLGHCPRDAITIEQREAAAFDERATAEHLSAREAVAPAAASVCPGLASMMLGPVPGPAGDGGPPAASRLGHWPVQLKLVPTTAPYFADADLLLAADCVPFAMADFHRRLLDGRSVVVGCPKLDDVDFYAEKLASILASNRIRSLMVVHMQVPCCSGLTRLARRALARASRPACFDDVTISLRGEVLDCLTIDVMPETQARL